MTTVRALVPTGYGLNCDYETDHALKLAGAESRRIHINDLIDGSRGGAPMDLDDFHILALGGGFSWGDDHGAGVILASKLRTHLGEKLERFVRKGKLIIGICNGFQALVKSGLLPAFNGNFWERRAAITYNDSGNFIDTWVRLKVHPESPCVFTRGITHIELPVRHGEGKFFAEPRDIQRLFDNKQVAIQYADERGDPAGGRWPYNPNGSLMDIAGICDPTGRIFGLMPHPEAFNHWANHPDWPRKKEELRRLGKEPESREGDGVRIFRNAVAYIKEAIESGRLAD
ncbi:MAG: phosphoribosylformylglycinamidine synthase subunit PurQ [Deltaproteobacteria bacterium]|nr:phosphoribosylformylglycinamidine synthase subunit PurQ [Deltaproteobacteria bacterium]MBW2017380.1 phosphoribosylformylglycinamidine synthase subunit PurQ [Deltaproteobacteria bacterium]MBW2128216.1 phosphoribosylformylglycinamidine synthase subunit PurQ [Deltaproteobacteria bacterium]MBW2303254.1 phosphoribosylformylglycinamidine synthase subunit PurQ [Deltaproteobacteria bacterium]